MTDKLQSLFDRANREFPCCRNGKVTERHSIAYTVIKPPMFDFRRGMNVPEIPNEITVHIFYGKDDTQHQFELKNDGSMYLERFPFNGKWETVERNCDASEVPELIFAIAKELIKETIER